MLGGVLLCSATSSSALTLGRVRGAALLGQPLELTVPVQTTGDEDASGLCFEADVFYGDKPQDVNRIVVTNEASRMGGGTVVRVIAYAHVDEPVVTVYLRSSCGHQTMRRYVLLADLASEVESTLIHSTSDSESALVSAQPATVKSVGRGRAGSTDAGKTAHSAISETGKSSSTHQTTRSVLQPVAAVSNSKPSARGTVAGQPRLKLAILDLAQDLDPTLKISNELVFPLFDDVKKREEAKVLWRALNTSPEDVLSGGGRVQDMENSVKLLQEQTSKNRLAMLELAGRLEKVQSQRYFNPLIYSLIALLVASGAALAYGWSRWRSAGLGSAPWWRNQNSEEFAAARELDSVLQDEPLQAGVKPVETLDATFTRNPVASLTEVDIDLQLAESAFSDLGKTAPFQSEKSSDLSASSSKEDACVHRNLTPKVPGSAREVNSQEMLDTRQQADFFMTLGQYEDAIHVLEGCIQEGGEPSPLAYLDLLKIFHTLSRKADYDRYRAQFNQLFTGCVPEFPSFHDGGSGLEDYPDVCEQIVALWPSKEALEYIGKCLVRTQEHGFVQEFKLEAYCDLLMLHGVMKQLTLPLKSGLPPLSVVRAHASSVQHTFNVNQATPTLPEFSALGVSVDLDLSEPMSNSIEFDAVGNLADQPTSSPDRP